MRIETLAVHAGHGVDPASGAVTPPIHLSSTFERDPDGGYRAGHIYTRTSNPNRTAVEQALAQLEGGAVAIAFSSGSAATQAVFQALAPGDHVLAPNDAYYGTLRQLREIFAPWGLEVDVVDMANLDAVERALRPNTRLVWVETPSNPLVRVVDIARLAELAHSVGARCAVDNTWATPVLQLPLREGADLVMHSTTKYLGGHSDLLGGALVARVDDELTQRLLNIQKVGGAVPSPFDSWLLLRGIRTLPWRMRAHCENASLVATFLSTHPKVEIVHYPGLASHSGHEIARRQMNDFGGMLSVQVRGGREAALELTRRLSLFTRATSLGGTESLIEHRASVEGAVTLAPENLLRVSVGLEHPDDLIEDLERALAGI
ncbi:MAG: aminotransferase class I/II-fold pyridoxal phosphate-dependent enzyme [Gemmatimonadaceae bacterium]|nr:aminotransferase class I/II-fold pyridoxal phosphate-dependent enzyme [Gemmatimonadaceae bacterium]NUP72656.1 aminotransferase class I/II-fold pyridoxal phosphate-dependent enzyme [Gemmatimonadaceae bacterium]